MRLGDAFPGFCSAQSARHAIVRVMPKDELIIQLIKIALGVAIGSYFLWWSLEVLQRLPPR